MSKVKPRSTDATTPTGKVTVKRAPGNTSSLTIRISWNNRKGKAIGAAIGRFMKEILSEEQQIEFMRQLEVQRAKLQRRQQKDRATS